MFVAFILHNSWRWSALPACTMERGSKWCQFTRRGGVRFVISEHIANCSKLANRELAALQICSFAEALTVHCPFADDLHRAIQSRLLSLAFDVRWLAAKCSVCCQASFAAAVNEANQCNDMFWRDLERLSQNIFSNCALNIILMVWNVL